MHDKGSPLNQRNTLYALHIPLPQQDFFLSIAPDEIITINEALVFHQLQLAEDKEQHTSGFKELHTYEVDFSATTSDVDGMELDTDTTTTEDRCDAIQGSVPLCCQETPMSLTYQKLFSLSVR
jgi:hypothetical protein